MIDLHDFSSQALVSRILEILSQDRQLSYAILAPDLTVSETSKNFIVFQSDSSREIVGSHIYDIFLELVGSESALEEVQLGKTQIFKLDNINRELKDGTTIYFSMTISPLDLDRPNQGLLFILENSSLSSRVEQMVVQDRNELRLTKDHLSKANEELQKLNRLKSLFLSIAAHDLRSPLTAMRGYTDLALQGLVKDTQPRVYEYLSIVLSLVETLNRLISDFLDLDVIEQGKLKIRPEACALNPIVVEVSNVMRGFAGRKNVQLETRLLESLPNVLGDPGRLRQILFNLITNAIKYTNENDSVILETYLDSNQAVIRVTDHGPGIPQDEIGNLFDLYHRTEGARQSQTQGLGLGLFIVKSLVDLHNGEISVSSELKKGTSFRISLPLYPTTVEGEG